MSLAQQYVLYFSHKIFFGSFKSIGKQPVHAKQTDEKAIFLNREENLKLLPKLRFLTKFW